MPTCEVHQMPTWEVHQMPQLPAHPDLGLGLEQRSAKALAPLVHYPHCSSQSWQSYCAESRSKSIALGCLELS